MAIVQSRRERRGRPSLLSSDTLKRIEKRTLTPIKRMIRRLGNTFVPVRIVSPANYDAYKATQNEGNRRKIDLVAACEVNIADIASYARRRIGPRLSVLCHGTRNGAEIRWFEKNLPDANRVLGTEIADTAGQFPNTIQWDFHDVKDEWLGAWDVIYSNSWDHAFDPERAFRNWMRCLSPRGLIFLEHCHSHTPVHATSLDPFGATLPALTRMLERIGSPTWAPVEVIEDLPDRRERRRVVVVGTLQRA